MRRRCVPGPLLGPGDEASPHNAVKYNQCVSSTLYSYITTAEVASYRYVINMLCHGSLHAVVNVGVVYSMNINCYQTNSNFK